MRTEHYRNYFLDRQEKYLKSLSPLFSAAEKVLHGQIPADQVPSIIKGTKDRFPALLAELPYLGGDWNLFNSSIISGVAALAYIRVLEEQGIQAEIIHKSIYDIYFLAYDALPGMIKTILRWNEFGRRHMHQLKAYAERTQEREHAENYVVRFIPGDGKTFDFGFDCEECALVSYYKHLGAEQHLPYICAGDYASSRALRTGLRRSTTISFGGKCCDFRYKRNSLGFEGYPIEELPEFRFI